MISQNLTLVLLVAGVLLVVAGRKIYLFSIGLIGFLAGMYLFSEVGGTEGDWKLFLLALLVGFLGAMLALFVQRAAWLVGGFLGGGILIVYVSDLFGSSLGLSPPTLFIAGGTVGAILFFLLMDWALIVLTTMTGAYLIIDQTGPGGLPSRVLFFLLVAAGLLIQGKSLEARRKSRKK